MSVPKYNTAYYLEHGTSSVFAGFSMVNWNGTNINQARLGYRNPNYIIKFLSWDGTKTSADSLQVGDRVSIYFKNGYVCNAMVGDQYANLVSYWPTLPSSDNFQWTIANISGMNISLTVNGLTMGVKSGAPEILLLSGASATQSTFTLCNFACTQMGDCGSGYKCAYSTCVPSSALSYGDTIYLKTTQSKYINGIRAYQKTDISHKWANVTVGATMNTGFLFSIASPSGKTGLVLPNDTVYFQMLTNQSYTDKSPVAIRASTDNTLVLIGTVDLSNEEFLWTLETYNASYWVNDSTSPLDGRVTFYNSKRGGYMSVDSQGRVNTSSTKTYWYMDSVHSAGNTCSANSDCGEGTLCYNGTCQAITPTVAEASCLVRDGSILDSKCLGYMRANNTTLTWPDERMRCHCGSGDPATIVEGGSTTTCPIKTVNGYTDVCSCITNPNNIPNPKCWSATCFDKGYIPGSEINEDCKYSKQICLQIINVEDSDDVTVDAQMECKQYQNSGNTYGIRALYILLAVGVVGIAYLFLRPKKT